MVLLGGHMGQCHELKDFTNGKKRGKIVQRGGSTMKPETKYIREIKKACEEEGFRNRHLSKPEKDFTRNRKLSLTNTIFYTLGNNRSSCSMEAYRFCKISGCETLSEAAIRKARKKISYTGFRELFVRTAQIASAGKEYRGYQLVAVDGMKGVLPKVPALTEKYGRQNDHAAVFHAVAAYDVLNEVFLDSDFSFGIVSEYEHGVELLDEVVEHSRENATKKIWIFDRGFPSLWLIQHLNAKKQKYVMRVSNHFIREVNEFRASKAEDKQVKVAFDHRRLQTNRVKSEGEMTFEVRCVRIQLTSGEEEILITNLDRKEFTKGSIQEIYRLRWGIETGFQYLKHAVFVEEFTSRNENGIQQDYYASLLVYNFATCICGSVWSEMLLKKGRKTGESSSIRSTKE